MRGSASGSDALRSHRTILALLLLAAALVAGYAALTRRGPALADEFIYLAGARHFAATGSLDARFYDARALLHQGYPHQDNHAPGYVLALGALTRVVRGGYWTAVALNVCAYLVAMVCVYGLARYFGRSRLEAGVAGALLLCLPALLPYVFWAMAELVLVASLLLTLLAAAHLGASAAGGALVGLLFGATFLVRESALFALPAVLSLLRGRRALAAALASALAFGAFVYRPLSARRSEGASNFWNPTYGQEFGFQVVQAGQRGDVASLARIGLQRARMNVAELVSATTTHAERAILLAFALLPCAGLLGWRQLTTTERRFLVCLTGGWLAMLSVMTFVYVLARWAGFRYLLLLAPPFLPLVARPRPGARLRWAAAAGLGLLFVAINLNVLTFLNAYKASRQRRQKNLTEYLERRIDSVALQRVVAPNAWQFGLEHYPVEVISSLPEGGGQLRVLEQQLWFDYLVLPGDSPLGPEWDARARYRRTNPGEPDAPLLVYRRLK